MIVCYGRCYLTSLSHQPSAAIEMVLKCVTGEQHKVMLPYWDKSKSWNKTASSIYPFYDYTSTRTALLHQSWVAWAHFLSRGYPGEIPVSSRDTRNLRITWISQSFPTLALQGSLGLVISIAGLLYLKGIDVSPWICLDDVWNSFDLFVTAVLQKTPRKDFRCCVCSSPPAAEDHFISEDHPPCPLLHCWNNLPGARFYPGTSRRQ